MFMRMSVPEVKHMWTDCCMHCFPRFLWIVQALLLLPEVFQNFTPSWSANHHLKSIDTYCFSFAEPKNWPVICFQIIFFPDRPITFWMFKKGLLTLSVVPEDFQTSHKWLERVELCGQHNSNTPYEFFTWCVILYCTRAPQQQPGLRLTLAATVCSVLQAGTKEKGEKGECRGASPHCSRMSEPQWLLYIGNILSMWWGTKDLRFINHLLAFIPFGKWLVWKRSSFPQVIHLKYFSTYY